MPNPNRYDSQLFHRCTADLTVRERVCVRAQVLSPTERALEHQAASMEEPSDEVEVHRRASMGPEERCWPEPSLEEPRPVRTPSTALRMRADGLRQGLALRPRASR